MWSFKWSSRGVVDTTIFLTCLPAEYLHQQNAIAANARIQFYDFFRRSKAAVFKSPHRGHVAITLYFLPTTISLYTVRMLQLRYYMAAPAM